MIKVVAFDLFGTLFDFSGVPVEEKRAYGRHIKQPNWSPLVLPESWADLPVFPDVAEGLQLLRKLRLSAITCSNAPAKLQDELIRRNNLAITGVPLDGYKVFKPNPYAYECVRGVMYCQPDEFLMVTANKDFGDIEAARSLGMQAILIRGENHYPGDVIELAEMLRWDMYKCRS